MPLGQLSPLVEPVHHSRERVAFSMRRTMLFYTRPIRCPDLMRAGSPEQMFYSLPSHGIHLMTDARS
jgi:hypothetical protein